MVVASAVSAVHAAPAAAATPSSDDVQSFVTMAQQVMARRTAVLAMSAGTAVSVSPITENGVAESPAEIDHETAEMTSLSDKRDVLDAREEQFSSSSVSVDLIDSGVDVTSGDAYVDVREHGSLVGTAQTAADGVTTEWQTPRRFYFSGAPGSWTLESQEVLAADPGDGSVADPDDDGPGADEDAINEPVLSVTKADMTQAVTDEPEATEEEGEAERSAAIMASPPITAELTATAYDRFAARDYAYKYWNSTHPAFPRFAKDDCTNFASQVVHAGGWPYTSTTENDSHWWKSGSMPDVSESRSFRIVHDFFEYAVTNSHRGVQVAHSTALDVGDIIMLDSSEHGDGLVHHTMIVTRKSYTSTGKIRLYLTYHTTDRKDRSLDDIKADYPGRRLVFIALKDTI